MDFSWFLTYCVKWDNNQDFKQNFSSQPLSVLKVEGYGSKSGLKLERRPNFSRQDTLKHCLLEHELGCQTRGQRTKLCCQKKRKQPCGSLKGAVPPDKETLEAAVSPICAASRMHSYFLSEQQRDNVKKPPWHLTFLLVSLFIARQCDSPGFFLKVERCEKKIQVWGSDIERWHAYPYDCLQKGWE